MKIENPNDPWYVPRSKSHAADFEEWKKGISFLMYDTLEEVWPGHPMKMKKGDVVKMVNGNGVLIIGLTVMGFGHPNEFARCIYLDWDCYWTDIHPERIIHVYGQAEAKADTLRTNELFIYKNEYNLKVDSTPKDERFNRVRYRDIATSFEHTMKFDVNVTRLV